MILSAFRMASASMIEAMRSKRVRKGAAMLAGVNLPFAGALSAAPPNGQLAASAECNQDEDGGRAHAVGNATE
jgi:hypothetical protein